MSMGFRTAAMAALGAATILAVSAPAAASPAQPLRELRCDLMDQHRGRLRTFEAPNLHVLEQTAGSAQFAPEIPQGTSAMMCARTNVLPAMNDDKVLALGLPLFIAETGTPGRLGVLEIDEGRYRFRMLEGELASDESQALERRLAEFQRRFAAATAPQR